MDMLITKKYISLLLAATIILTIFCSCNKNNSTSTADTYLAIAQEHLDNEDIASALGILQKGFAETSDPRLAVLMAEISLNKNSDSSVPENTTADTTIASSETVIPVFDDSYIGTWAEKNISNENGGLIIDINKNDDTVSFDVSFTQAAPYSRVANFSVNLSQNNINSDRVELFFENDGWDNTGKIIFQFMSNTILCTIKDTSYLFDGECPMWGIYEGEYLLIKQDDAYDKLYDDSSEYTEDAAINSASSPTIAQINADLLYWGANCFTIDGDDIYLDINYTELQFVRAELFANVFTYSVQFQNEYYAVDATYDMYYVYDRGNWIYSSHQRTDYIIYAIKSQIDQNKVITACKQKFDTYEIIDHTYYLNEDKVFVDTIMFQGTLQSHYITEVFDCTYTYYFEDGYWKSDWDITRQSIDWSNLEGQWVFEHFDEYIRIDILDITQKDAKNLTVKYSYETSPWCDDGPWDGYFSSSTDGSSRTESNLVRTCEINLKSEDFNGNHNIGNNGYNYTHLYPCAFSIPLEIGGWKVDWFEGFFIVYFDIDKGFYISEFQYLYKDPTCSDNSWEWQNDSKQKAVYFKKQIDWDNVQNAIDKLESMNP